jgi:glycosyltransferase 2 family protein
MFANNFLPTGFGGDAARVLMIARAGASTGRAVASVIVDRATALACLVLLAWLAAAVAPDDVPRSLLGTLAIATASGVVTAAVLALVIGRGRPRRVKEEAWAAIGGPKRARSVLLVTTFGLLYQGLMVLAAWILARSIDLNLSFALLAVVTPLVIMATLFPISIAGFGIHEGTYIALLAETGVSASDAALFSLLNVAALAIATLPGAFALLLSGDRRARVVVQ